MRLLEVIYRLLDLYQVLIIVQCILSWFVRGGGGLVQDVYEALSTLVDPYLNLFRRHIPPVGGVDWTPLLALIVLQLVQRIIL